MEKIAFILFLTFSLLPTDSTAQKMRKSIEKEGKKFTGLRAGFYTDNAVHPGLKFGTSYLLKEKEKERKRRLKFVQNKRGNKVKQIQYLADGNVGFYNHPNNHTGVFLGIGLTRHRVKVRKKRKGQKIKTLGWSLEANYLHRFYNIKTYELDENGAIQTVPLAGSNSLMFAISPAFGRIYGIQNGGKGYEIFIKPSLQMLKYNHAFFPNASLEVGINLNIL